MTQEVMERDSESISRKDAGGGDPIKSGRISVGAAKEALFGWGPRGSVHAKPSRLGPIHTVGEEIRRSPAKNVSPASGGQTRNRGGASKFIRTDSPTVERGREVVRSRFPSGCGTSAPAGEV